MQEYQIVIGILAGGDRKIYTKFFDLHRKNAEKYKNKIKIFFLVGKKEIDDIDQPDMLYNTEPDDNLDIDITSNTIQFYKYVLDNYKFKWCLRTSLSTLINYEMLLKKYTYGIMNTIDGPRIDDSKCLSGTFMIMSKDIVEFLYKNELLIKDKIKTERFGEDLFSSMFLFKNKEGVMSKNLNRIDFINYKNIHIKNIVNYHHCQSDCNNIFIFRFKTLDREQDFKNMSDLLSNNFDYINLIIKLNWEIVEQSPFY